MNLCSENHQEVCFEEDGNCPMCALITNQEEELAAKDNEIGELKQELESVSAELESLREPVICAVKVIREEMLNEQRTTIPR